MGQSNVNFIKVGQSNVIVFKMGQSNVDFVKVRQSNLNFIKVGQSNLNFVNVNSSLLLVYISRSAGSIPPNSLAIKWKDLYVIRHGDCIVEKAFCTLHTHAHATHRHHSR